MRTSSVPDPDALAAEFAARGVPFAAPLEDTSDGLRGFIVKDPDGYGLFFARPFESKKPRSSSTPQAARRLLRR